MVSIFGFHVELHGHNVLILAPTVFLKFEQQIIFSQDMRFVHF